MYMRLHVSRFGCGRQALLYLSLSAFHLVGLSPLLHAADKESADIVEQAAGVAVQRWGTLSGLTAHPTDPHRLFAVTDKKSAPPRILEISLAKGAPRIIGEIVVKTPAGLALDLEGVTATRDGGFWIASEGGSKNDPPNVLLKVNQKGEVLQRIDLPSAIASKVSGKGFEGVAIDEDGATAKLYVAVQGPLRGEQECRALIGSVDVGSGQWSFWFYPLERLPLGDCTGLSEILYLGKGRFAVIERDGNEGPTAKKWITIFDLTGVAGAAAGTAIPMVSKRRVFDFVSFLTRLHRDVEREIEGLAVAQDGSVYAVTDNDLVRPTLLMRLGYSAEVLGK